MNGRAAVTAGPTEAASRLRQRAALLAVLSTLFDASGVELAKGDLLGDLAALAGDLGELQAAETLAALASAGPFDAGRLAASAVYWFEHGRLPAYEYSNVGASVGGHTAGLADVAGFYRAFGVEPVSDRPDHLMAELEFLAFVNALEADATDDGRAEAADVCAQAARHFLRDHVGRWIDGWAARIGDAAPQEPWGLLGRAAALLVASEARRRRVIPVLANPVFGPGADPLDDPDLACEEGLSVT